jgi:hypothetical protein
MMAVELISRVNSVRQLQSGATPIVTLASRPMKTRFGITRPRPCFHDEGWRFPRHDVTPSLPPPSHDDGMDDDIPF